MDLRLNDDWDVDFEDGDLRMTSGQEEVAQRLGFRHGTGRGEWRFNTEFGLPYRQEIFVKDYNLGRIGVFIRRQVLTTPGVLRIEDLDVSVDSSQELQVEYTAITRDGAARIKLKQQVGGIFGLVNAGYGPGIM